MSCKMRSRHRRIGRRILACLLFAVVAGTAGCREPTQIKLELTTNVLCSEVVSTAIRVGLLGDIGDVPPVTTTSRCDPATGRIGSLVAVPRSADDAPIAIRVTTAFGDADANCKPSNEQPQCIEARRLIHYLPYKSLVLPIRMQASCAGIDCDNETETCIDGTCRDATVDPTLCARAEGCGEDTVGGGPPACANGKVDPGETDIDCGGVTCEPCADGKVCASAADCVSQRCQNQKCTATTAPHSIAAGRSHTCARKTDGTLWCWGINDKGQLGNGTTGRDNAKPAKVQLLNSSVAEVAEVAEVAAGYDHTCARKLDGTLWCWGNNIVGQLGDATAAQPNVRNVPFQAEGLVGAETLDAGGDHACASTTAKEFYCWGRGDYGQLGVPMGSSTNKPTKVPAGLPVERAISVAAGGFHTCAAFEGGDVYCWGRNESGQVGDTAVDTPQTLPLKVKLPKMAEQVVAGDSFSCARLIDGTLWCWGDNSYGQLGTSGATRSSPKPVSGLPTSVAEVAAGEVHTCAREIDGTLWCWGRNNFGQLGTVGDNTVSPRKVLDLEASVAEVAAGYRHTCARKNDGTLWCWGWNDAGQLANKIQVGGSSASPVSVW